MSDRPRGDEAVWKNGSALRAADLPVWVRAAAIVGIPGVIAFFLVWVGASDIPKISRTVEQNQIKIDYLLKVIEERERTHNAHDEHLLRLMQQMCVHQAKQNQVEIRECFE